MKVLDFRDRRYYDWFYNRFAYHGTKPHFQQLQSCGQYPSGRSWRVNIASVGVEQTLFHLYAVSVRD